MDKNKRAELLKDEYVMLQQFYEDIDGKGLTIKNWAVTVALAAIGAGILYKSSLILAIAFGASLVFWYLEAYWRGLSHFFVVRINEIEAIFNDGKLDKALPLQVYSKWTEEYDKRGEQTLRYMGKKAVLIPHVIIAGLSLVIWILSLYGYLK
jgi:hypothetical protein